MQKIMNVMTKTVHVVSQKDNRLDPHCGAYVPWSSIKTVSKNTKVTCGHCRRIFKNDSRVAGAKAKGRENTLRGMKGMSKHHSTATHAFFVHLKPDSLKALIDFMENHSDAQSMSEAINEIIPEYVAGLKEYNLN